MRHEGQDGDGLGAPRLVTAGRDGKWDHLAMAPAGAARHTPYAAFGAWLVVRLGELDLDQAEVARHLGLTRQAVSMWATGKQRPAPETCWLLAGELGVPIERILRLCDYPPDTLAAQPGRSEHTREVPVIDRTGRPGAADAVIGHFGWAPPMPEARGADRFFAVIADAADQVGPLVAPGDYVIVDREARPVAGRVICLRLADRLELRRFEQRHGRFVVAREDGQVEPWEPLATAYVGLVIQSQAPPKYP